MPETFYLAFIVILAGFLQGLTGFGFGLIALPLLSLFLPIKTIVPLVVMLALFISLTLTIQFRNAVRLKSMAALLAATLPGIPLGIYALTTIPSSVLALFVGALMVAFTSFQLFAKPKPRELGLPTTLGAGFVSGFLSGSISTGGPPVIIYSAIQPWSKDQAKATLACYFLTSGIVTIAAHAYAGVITGEVLRHFLYLFPALVIGIFIGTWTYRHLSDHGYRRLAIILVFILGVMMIVRNI